MSSTPGPVPVRIVPEGAVFNNMELPTLSPSFSLTPRLQGSHCTQHVRGGTEQFGVNAQSVGLQKQLAREDVWEDCAFLSGTTMSAVVMSMFLLRYKMNTIHFIHQQLNVPSETEGSGPASRFSASHTEDLGL